MLDISLSRYFFQSFNEKKRSDFSFFVVKKFFSLMTWEKGQPVEGIQFFFQLLDLLLVKTQGLLLEGELGGKTTSA